MDSPSLGFLGNTIRYYIDKAEKPFAVQALILALFYILTFWLQVSYLDIVAPFTMALQVVVASVTAYVVGIQTGASWKVTAIICIIVGFAGGVVSALLSLVRFWYPWLIMNLIVEPVWSGLLAGTVSLLTIGFFGLPRVKKLINR